VIDERKPTGRAWPSLWSGPHFRIFLVAGGKRSVIGVVWCGDSEGRMSGPGLASIIGFETEALEDDRDFDRGDALAAE
jgi:hypothetical protein